MISAQPVWNMPPSYVWWAEHVKSECCFPGECFPGECFPTPFTAILVHSTFLTQHPVQRECFLYWTINKTTFWLCGCQHRNAPAVVYKSTETGFSSLLKLDSLNGQRAKFKHNSSAAPENSSEEEQGFYFSCDQNWLTARLLDSHVQRQGSVDGDFSLQVMAKNIIMEVDFHL